MTTEAAPSHDIDRELRAFCCHGGSFSGRFRPNSLAAVLECVERRVPRLEVDLRFTAGDTMLVFHDGLLDAATDAAGRVADLSAADCRDLRYRDGTPVARFEEVCDALAGSCSLLQVDLKLMRPITAAQVASIAATAGLLQGRIIVGSRADWNLAPLRAAGLPIAFDPSLHFHHDPTRPSDAVGRLPVRLGLHGFWDDSPLAHLSGFSAGDYLRMRLAELAALAPGVREIMMDVGTLFAMEDRGVRAGDEFAALGIELAAWTVHDAGPEANRAAVERLFGLGVRTVITDAPRELAASIA